MELIENTLNRLLSLIKLGVAQSTAKLADISGASWDVHIISVDLGTSERFRSILARDKREYLGASFSTPGESYLVMFSEESGKTLVRSCSLGFGTRGKGIGFERSSLAEIANILISGLSGELAERQGMSRILSAPTLLTGRKAAICAQAFGTLEGIGDQVMIDALIHISSPSLAADCTLMLRLDSVTATFLMSPDPDAA